MKRSRSVRLTLMGAATATTVAACEPAAVQPPAFSDVAACITAGNSETACRSSHEEALKAHQEKAPRFSSKDECLRATDVSDCTQTAVRQSDGSTTSMFIPLMAGYMLANVVQRAGGGFYGGPIYRSRTATGYRDMDDVVSGRQTGTVTSRPPSVPTINRPANVGTTTIARSGFGSSRSSFGGSSS